MVLMEGLVNHRKNSAVFNKAKAKFCIRKEFPLQPP